MWVHNLDILSIIFSYINEPNESPIMCSLFDVCKNFQNIITDTLNNRYILLNILKFKIDDITKYKMVKILIDKCDVNAKNNWDETALMYSAEIGHVECVKLLIDKGCDVKAKYIYGCTALMIATFYGHYKCVELLIENGCDVNAKTIYGSTALMIAASNGRTECIKLLIDKCDINAKNNLGKTALMFAIENKHTECVKLLGGRVIDCFCCSCIC